MSDESKRFDGRWVHCLSCDHVAIRCEVCDNLSCTGGGCDKCHNDFVAVSEMPREQLPSTLGMSKTGGGSHIMFQPNFFSDAEKAGVTAGEWLNSEHQKFIDRVIAKEKEFGVLDWEAIVSCR